MKQSNVVFSSAFFIATAAFGQPFSDTENKGDQDVSAVTHCNEGYGTVRRKESVRRRGYGNTEHRYGGCEFQ